MLPNFLFTFNTNRKSSYLTADYDRSQFTVSPCVWPSTFTQDIYAIYQPNSTLAIVNNKKGSSTPIGAIVGGVVGGVVFLLAAFLLFWFCYLKPRRKKPAELPATKAGESDTPLDPNGTPHPTQSELDPASREFAEMSAYEEAEKKRQRLAEAEIAGTPILGHEMDSHTPVGSELGGEGNEIFEMPGNEAHEMPAREPVGSEMPTPVPSPLGSPRSTERSPMLSGASTAGQRSPLSRGVSTLGEEKKHKRFSYEED